MRYRVIAVLAAMALLSGCASIVSGQNQSLSVVAKSSDSHGVMGAKCSLANDKGQWFTTTPGSVTVRRSYSNLAVNCQHSGSTGIAQVKSTTKPMAFGNIIFGGVIGVGVDVATGAAYDYPDLVTVQMLSAEQASPERTTTAPPAPDVPVAAAVPVIAVVAPVAPTAVPALKPTERQTAPTQQPALPAAMTAPAAADRVTLVSQDAKLGGNLKGGQDSFSAEHLPEVKACAAQPRAVLTGKGPGFETYTVGCANGDVLAVRCELGNCRVLH